MIPCQLVRISTGDTGTFGHLTVNDHLFVTGELPWRDNHPQTSCISTGTYKATWFNSPKHGWCYLLSVPGRSMVEIHSANWMGDASKGMKCQLLGCIALGQSRGIFEGQDAILESKLAIEKFHELTNGEDLEISITEDY